MDFWGLLQEIVGMVVVANAVTGHKASSILENIPIYLEEFAFPAYRIDSGKKR